MHFLGANEAGVYLDNCGEAQSCVQKFSKERKKRPIPEGNCTPLNPNDPATAYVIVACHPPEDETEPRV